MPLTLTFGNYNITNPLFVMLLTLTFGNYGDDYVINPYPLVCYATNPYVC